MPRLLIALGLALAGHALLFWWGHHWHWQPFSAAEHGQPALELTLTTSMATMAPAAPAAPAAKDQPETATTATTPPATTVETAPESLPPPARAEPEPVVAKLESELKPVLQPKPESEPQPELEKSEPKPESQPKPELQPKPKPQTKRAAPELEKSGAAPNLLPQARAADKENQPSKQFKPYPASSTGAKPQPSAAEASSAADGAPEQLTMARPLYRENPPPPYPPAARSRRYQGTVMLEVLVNQGGKAEEIRVLESSGYPLLDRAAVSGVQSWLFEPGRRNGVPIAMWVQVPIRFTLR